jgi:uncharacterized membrane protein (DUF106 family)
MYRQKASYLSIILDIILFKEKTYMDINELSKLPLSRSEQLINEMQDEIKSLNAKFKLNNHKMTKLNNEFNEIMSDQADVIADLGNAYGGMEYLLEKYFKRSED